MIKVTILYGNPEDPAAFERHYDSVHRSLFEKIPNVRHFQSARALVPPDGTRPPYHRSAELYFDSLDLMQSGMNSPEGRVPSADARDFATGGVTIFVSEVGV